MTISFLHQNAHTIESLTAAIAEAQRLLEQLKTPQLTTEGWSTTRANKTPNTPEQKGFAPRHGCEWNNKEERDLIRKWFQFASVDTLAKVHQRTEGGIRSELQRLLYTANMDVLLDEICGTKEKEYETS